MIMLSYWIFACVTASLPIIWTVKRSVPFPLYTFGILCLILQVPYLWLVVFDTTGEMWMALALTYLPASIAIFVALGVLCGFRVVNKRESIARRVGGLAILPLYGFGSYLILTIWGNHFDFPL